MINPESQFPEKVDPLIFFADLSNTNAENFKTHRSMTEKGQYQEAVEFAHNNSIDIFDATLMNCLTNRLHALQEYIETLGRDNHHVFSDDPSIADGYQLLGTDQNELILTDTDDEILVEEVPVGCIWISNYSWN